MQPVEVKKDIYWVGAVDWNIRDFHGYSTGRGTTYNAYLAKDEKIALFDTVKRPFLSDLLHRLHNLVELSQIDYLVVNHMEMDHSGCLPELVDLIKPEKIFCSKMGRENMLAHYHTPDWPYEVVTSGDSIELGRNSVHFLETRMLHWPDSMFSYLPQEKLLISSDAFGQHWATSQRFADQVDEAELFRHATKYFANILMPYSPLIQKLLAKVGQLGLEIETIAPDHGLIWRSAPEKIISAYDRWSTPELTAKALVVYDSMWRSTEMMAQAVVSGLVEEGVVAVLFDLKCNHRSDVLTEILDAKGLVCGSPTLNNGIMPLMGDFLTYLKGLRPAGRVGAAFGSYGWSGESLKVMNQALEEMKIELVDPGVKVQYRPEHSDLAKCVELGRKVGRAVKESV